MMSTSSGSGSWDQVGGGTGNGGDGGAMAGGPFVMGGPTVFGPGFGDAQTDQHFDQKLITRTSRIGICVKIASYYTYLC